MLISRLLRPTTLHFPSHSPGLLCSKPAPLLSTHLRTPLTSHHRHRPSNSMSSSTPSSSSPPAPTCTVESLDHLVLTVVSIPATIAFYTSHLGMTHTPFTTASPSNPNATQTRHSLVFGAQKINLHQSGAEFEPKAANVRVGSGDLCFVTQDRIDDVLGRLKAAGVEVLEGGQVVDRTGAKGELRSVYVRDPDGNLVE